MAGNYSYRSHKPREFMFNEDLKELMKIYKYVLPLSGSFTMELPIDSHILSFQTQHDELTIWAVVWPNSSTEERRFSIIGTGDEFDFDLVTKYIGTTQMHNGNLVWHLFEMK